MQLPLPPLQPPPQNLQAQPIPPQPPQQQQQQPPGQGIVPAALAANLLVNLQNQQAQQRLLMEQALIRLGTSQAATTEFINNGITSLERLRMLSKDGLERLIKQMHRGVQGGVGFFIPLFTQELIYSIHFWCNRMHIIRVPYGVEQVTQELALNWNQARKSETEASKAPQDMVKQPDAFKKETKWKQWKESMLTYLHSKTGQSSLPLAYIVRENDAPNNANIYATVHDQLVECAILTGPEFNINNGLVYDLLQSLTINGPAWAWINAFQQSRDGRNAWKSLIGYYEGDSVKTHSKQECYDSIAKANYQGP